MGEGGGGPVYLYRVMYPYTPDGNNSRQMAIVLNDKIEVSAVQPGINYESPGSVWLDGKNCRSLEVGIFPGNYVEFLERRQKHLLKNTYLERPELCSICDEYIWGMTGEGKICEVCNSVCHLSCEGTCCHLNYCKGSDMNNNVAHRNTPLHPDKWGVSSVCEWMASLNLYRYVELFRRHSIDGHALPELTADKLMSMGIQDEFHRASILVSVSELCGHNLDNVRVRNNFSVPAVPAREHLMAVPTDHSLVEHTFTSLQRCLVCYKLLQGLVRQGLQCSVCGMSVHRQCSFGKLPACGKNKLVGRRRPSFSEDPKFGTELQDQFSVTGKQSAPEILIRCIAELEKRALDTNSDLVDSYRLTPSPESVSKLKMEFNSDKAGDIELGKYDLVTIGGVVKKYLRELADPVIPLHMYERFIAAHEDSGQLSSLVNGLPLHHHATLIFLMAHFCRVCNQVRADGQAYRGSSVKLIQVFSHILMRPAWENILDIVKNSEIHIKILQKLLQLDLWGERLPTFTPEPAPRPPAMPARPSAEEMKLEQAPWYWPQLQREEVNELLADCIDGTFLVRNGKTPNDYTLTLRHAGVNKHIKIFHEGGVYGFAKPYAFPSVTTLVNYYGSHSLAEYNRQLVTMLKYPYTQEEDPSEGAPNPGEVETNLLRLRDLNDLYLKKQMRYDQALTEQTKVSQELTLRLQALEAYRETINVFEDQIKLQDDYQKKCSGVELAQLKDNYRLLSQRLNSVRESRRTLTENVRREEATECRLLGDIHSLKPEIKQLTKKRENLIRSLMTQNVSKEQIDRMLQQHEETVEDSNHESIYMRPNEEPEQRIPHHDESTWLVQCFREAAEEMVANKADGTFLIRPRAVPDSYALTIVHGGGRIDHCIISKKEKGYGFAEPFYIHDTLKDLVLHYRKVTLGEHNDELDVVLEHPVLVSPRL